MVVATTKRQNNKKQKRGVYMSVSKTLGRAVAKILVKNCKWVIKCAYCDKFKCESGSEMANHIFHNHSDKIEEALKNPTQFLNQDEDETEETATEKPATEKKQ